MLLVVSLNHLFPKLLALSGIPRDREIHGGFCLQPSQHSRPLHAGRAALAASGRQLPRGANSRPGGAARLRFKVGGLTGQCLLG